MASPPPVGRPAGATRGSPLLGIAVPHPQIPLPPCPFPAPQKSSVGPARLRAGLCDVIDPRPAPPLRPPARPPPPWSRTGTRRSGALALRWPPSRPTSPTRPAASWRRRSACIPRSGSAVSAKPGARREARGSAACAAAAGPDLSPSPRLRSARGARRESEFLGYPGGCPGVSGRGTGWDRISPEAGYRLGPGTDGLGSGTAGPPPLPLAGAPTEEGAGKGRGTGSALLWDPCGHDTPCWWSIPEGREELGKKFSVGCEKPLAPSFPIPLLLFLLHSFSYSSSSSSPYISPFLFLLFLFYSYSFPPPPIPLLFLFFSSSYSCSSPPPIPPLPLLFLSSLFLHSPSYSSTSYSSLSLPLIRPLFFSLPPFLLPFLLSSSSCSHRIPPLPLLFLLQQLPTACRQPGRG